MAKYLVDYEDVGFTTSQVLAEAFVDEEDLEQVNRSFANNSKFPAQVMEVTQVHACTDDGQTGEDIKSFVCVRLKVEAESAAAAENVIPVEFLTSLITSLLVTGDETVSLEGNWEVVDVQPTEPQTNA